MWSADGAAVVEAYTRAFVGRYQREFGFTLDRPIVVDDVRVRGTGRSGTLERGAARASRGKPTPMVSAKACVCFLAFVALVLPPCRFLPVWAFRCAFVCALDT